MVAHRKDSEVLIATLESKMQMNWIIIIDYCWGSRAGCGRWTGHRGYFGDRWRVTVVGQAITPATLDRMRVAVVRQATAATTACI